MIRMRLLGPVEVEMADGSTARSVLAQPKRLALLAYLALVEDGGYRGRDELLFTFWPDRPDDRARLALRVSLSFLRKSLESPELFETVGDRIRVAPEALSTDVADFTRLIREGDVTEALGHYRGEVMQGFHLSNNSQFAQWLDTERNSYRRTAWHAAQSEADEMETAGELEAGLAAASAAGRIHPLNEESTRSVLRFMCRGGDRAGALLYFESFRARLLEELESEPQEKTLALVEKLRSGAIEGRNRAVPGASEASILPPNVPARRAAASQRKRAWTTWGGWAVAAGVLAAMVAFVLVRPDSDPVVDRIAFARANIPITEVDRADRVLLLPFRSVGGDDSLEEILVLGNARVQSLVVPAGVGDVVPYGSVAHMFADEPRLNMTSAADSAAAARIIAADVHADSGILTIQPRIVDASTLVTLESLEPAKGSLEEPLGAFDVAAERILAALAHEYETAWQWPEDRPPPTLAIARMEDEAYQIFYSRRYDEFLELSETIVEESGSYLPVRIIGHRAAAYWNSQHLEPDRLHRADSIMKFLQSQEYRLSAAERQQNAWSAAQITGDSEAEYLAAWDGLDAPPNTGRAYQLMSSAIRSHRPVLALELAEKRHPRQIMAARFAGWDSGLIEALTHLRLFDDALKESRRAQQLHVGDGRWFRDEVYALAGLGRLEEIEPVIEGADFDETDRFNRPGLYVAASYVLFGEGDTVSAQHFAELALRAVLESGVDTRRDEAAALAYLSRWEEAAQLYEEIVADDGTPPVVRAPVLGDLGAAYANAGRRGEAMQVLQRTLSLEQETSGLYIAGLAGWSRARIHTALGEHDLAIPLLETAVRTGRTFTEPWAEWDPHLLPLHGDPRYDALVAHRPR